MKANNYVSLYKALVSIADICDGADTVGLDERTAIYNIAQTVLRSAAPRNCDVGTAQEQAQRFHEFCHGTGIGTNTGRTDCSICALYKNEIGNCAIAWAQMPYEMENGK